MDRTAQAPRQRGRLHRRWAWALLAMVAVLAIALAVLPHVISQSIERWPRAQGADEATVANVDCNPFTRTAVLHDLQVTIAQEQVLNIPRAPEVPLGVAATQRAPPARAQCHRPGGGVRAIRRRAVEHRRPVPCPSCRTRHRAGLELCHPRAAAAR